MQDRSTAGWWDQSLMHANLVGVWVLMAMARNGGRKKRMGKLIQKRWQVCMRDELRVRTE